MARKQTIKQYLAHVATDKRPSVVAAHNQVLEPLNRIDRSRLQGGALAEYEDIGGELQNIMADFDHQYPTQCDASRASARQIKLFNALRVLGLTVILLLSLMLLIKDWRVGLTLFVVAIVANMVVKRILTARSESLARDSNSLAHQARVHLGHLESLDAPASGLAARADNLYLSLLTEIERMGETQRRQSERQMAVQQRQHEAQLAAMQANLDATNAALAEQRNQTDMLGGSRGFLGSAITSYERGKQDRNRK